MPLRELTDRLKQAEAELHRERQARHAAEARAAAAEAREKALLAACRQVGYHVHSGGHLELRGYPVGFVFIEAGGTLLVDRKPGQVQEAS